MSGARPWTWADRGGMAAAFDTVADRHGRIDVVFANAGIDAGPGFLSTEGHRIPEGAIDVLDDHHWDRVIEVNLTSVYTTVKHAARHMKRTGGGRIIVTSSIAAQINEAIVGTPYMPAKAGVDHFVRQMAMELGVYGILVNCISPGPFMTNIAGGRLKIAGGPPGLRSAVPDRQDRRYRGHQGPGALPRLALLVLRDGQPDGDRRGFDAPHQVRATGATKSVPKRRSTNEHSKPEGGNHGELRKHSIRPSRRTVLKGLGAGVAVSDD